MTELVEVPSVGSRRSAKPVRVLMLSSDEPGAFGASSGYTPLARHITGAKLLTTVRRSQTSRQGRFADRCVSRLALSRWYRTSSAQLEWQAWRELRRGFSGVVHTLWGERDLGFLDLIPRRRHLLCATFHACNDTFDATLVRPSRLRRLDAVILVSESQRPFFERHRVSPDRIHVCLLGIDTITFRPGSERVDRPFTVLSVGSYRRRYDLLRKVARGLRGVPAIQFVVIGPARVAAEFADEPNVMVRSGLTSQELVRAYQDASCLLMTVENSTANCALLEGMACGLPVVAETVGGIPEYAVPGCGVLTPPNQSSPLIEAIEWLARNPSVRDAMGQAARKRAEELAWPNVAQRMTEVYTHLGGRQISNCVGTAI